MQGIATRTHKAKQRTAPLRTARASGVSTRRKRKLSRRPKRRLKTKRALTALSRRLRRDPDAAVVPSGSPPEPVAIPAAEPAMPVAAQTAAQAAPSPWASGGKAALALAGVNLIGLIRSELGVGESGRLAAAALTAAGYPFGMIDLPGISLSRSLDDSWLHKEMNTAPYPVNVFHLNADVLPMARAYFGHELFQDRYNIGFWHWELPEFPDDMLGGFDGLQEVWVPSQFVFDSLVKKAPVCVVKMPHGITMPPPVELPRAFFGLPHTPFLFLSMFDTYSFQERKNPKGAIQAYLRAFPEPKPDQVGLVIKVNNADAQCLSELEELSQGRADIHLLPRILSRQHMNALMHSVQSFVSLHRSEGFGLGLAEAMYLGKPVIGTNWSGNTEFMHTENSCPVHFSLIHVGTTMGPYQANQLWADPDLEHAAYYMKRLYTDARYRQLIGDYGCQTIRTYFTPQLAGQRIRDRLGQLGF